jgi:hypothetical protein
MLHGSGFVVMDAVEFLDLSLAIPFHLLDLILDKGVQLLLFGVPSDCVLSQLAAQLFLSRFQHLYFQVASPDLVLLDLKARLKFLYHRVLLFVFFSQCLQFGVVLLLLKLGCLLEVISFL